MIITNIPVRLASCTKLGTSQNLFKCKGPINSRKVVALDLNVSAEGFESTLETWGKRAEAESSDESSDIRRQIIQELSLRDRGGKSTASEGEGHDGGVANHDDVA